MLRRTQATVSPHAPLKRVEGLHPIGTKPRLALALLLYTAQRRGDIVGVRRNG
jgi:hypothetical protein